MFPYISAGYMTKTKCANVHRGRAAVNVILHPRIPRVSVRVWLKIPNLN